MPCRSRVYFRKPAVHPALGSSPADQSCCRCRAEPLVHYRDTVASPEVECYAGSLQASLLPGCRLLRRAHRLVGDWVHCWRLLAPVWCRPRQAAGVGCITVATGPPGGCWSRAEAAVSPWQAFCGMQHCTAIATTPGAAARRGTLSNAARCGEAAVGPTLDGRGPPLGLARGQTRCGSFCFSRHYIPGSSIHEHQ